MMELGTILVTGGSSGLGAAVVDAVEKAGGTPIVLDIAEPQREVETEIVDLAHPRAAEEAVSRVVDRHGSVQGLVAAAGIDACGPLATVPAAAWERVIAVNLVGTAAVVRAALPALEAASGRIVAVASTLGYRAFSDATAYCASKFGVVGFSRALQLELAGRVGVILLIPGGMRTPFFDDRPEQYKPGPDAVLNDPAHVAEAVLFALRQPAGSEVRELVITSPVETSWP
jgi:NAD(P)-dependent dehydrogenase (short-subunit alcohol dehydrogenase family)